MHFVQDHFLDTDYCQVVEDLVKEGKTCLDAIATSLILSKMACSLNSIGEICHDTKAGTAKVCSCSSHPLPLLLSSIMKLFFHSLFFFMQVTTAYVKPLHPHVIDTFDTWHCVRSIIKGAEDILLKSGETNTTCLKGMKQYMTFLLLSLLQKYPNDPRKMNFYRT